MAAASSAGVPRGHAQPMLAYSQMLIFPGDLGREQREIRIRDSAYHREHWRAISSQASCKA